MVGPTGFEPVTPSTPMMGIFKGFWRVLSRFLRILLFLCRKTQPL